MAILSESILSFLVIRREWLSYIMRLRGQRRFYGRPKDPPTGNIKKRIRDRLKRPQVRERSVRRTAQDRY
jgi:hypothetical protein